jgi:hypothetical protein
MNIGRGLLAALALSLIGAVSAVFVICAPVLANLLLTDTHAIERQFDIRWLGLTWIGPSIGVSAYLGLAALATYTPTTNFGFARTLAIIFFLSIPVTVFIGGLELTPKRVKSITHPLTYPSEIAIFLLPPSVVAFLLLASRVKSVSGKSNETKTTEHVDG